MQLRGIIGTRRAHNDMIFSRTITYAVQATVAIARNRPDHPVSASRLAKSTSLPERFLPQILRRLVNKGVLISTKGVAGGYALSRSPNEITLFDIVDAIESPKEPAQFTLTGLSEAARERLRIQLIETSIAACDSLKNLTVAELIESHS